MKKTIYTTIAVLSLITSAFASDPTFQGTTNKNKSCSLQLEDLTKNGLHILGTVEVNQKSQRVGFEVKSLKNSHEWKALLTANYGNMNYDLMVDLDSLTAELEVKQKNRVKSTCQLTMNPESFEGVRNIVKTNSFNIIQAGFSKLQNALERNEIRLSRLYKYTTDRGDTYNLCIAHNQHGHCAAINNEIQESVNSSEESINLLSSYMDVFQEQMVTLLGESNMSHYVKFSSESFQYAYNQLVTGMKADYYETSYSTTSTTKDRLKLLNNFKQAQQFHFAGLKSNHRSLITNFDF
jgi:hypothetical protein